MWDLLFWLLMLLLKPSNINGSDGSNLFTLTTDDGTVKDVNVVTTITATSGTIGFLNWVEDRRLWR